VLFDGDFKNGLSAWPSIIHKERISVVDDPILGSARKVAKLTVYDGDTGPTENPRAQLEGPAMMNKGGEYWVGWSTLLPSDFPTWLPSNGWLAFESIYGPPYAGAGPMATRVYNGSSQTEIRYSRSDTYGYDNPWRTAINRGHWTDFAWHVKLSSDPSVGFVEIYMNTGSGWQQQLLKGQKRLYMKTMDASNNGGANNFRLGNYRLHGMFNVVTLYHASPKIGTSFDAVAPHSYGP
jgi:hypothetical protein